jgi:flagellar basal body rod protein FlgG
MLLALNFTVGFMKKFFFCLAMLMSVEQVFAVSLRHLLDVKTTGMQAPEGLLQIKAHNIANISAPTFPEIPELIISNARTISIVYQEADTVADSSEKPISAIDELIQLIHIQQQYESQPFETVRRLIQQKSEE